MTEPAADHIDLHTCLEQVHGRRVPESVRRDPASPAPRSRIEARSMATNDLIEAEARERGTPRRAKDCLFGTRQADRAFDETPQVLGGLLPYWARAPLVAFPMEADPQLAIQGEVADAEIRDLLDPRSRVVKEEQQSAITSDRRVGRQAGEEILDFRPIEVVRLGGRHTLGGDAHHLLGDDEKFRDPTTEIPEEGTEHREALVARADVVVSGVLQGS